MPLTIQWSGQSNVSQVTGYGNFPLQWYNTFATLGEAFGNIVFGPLPPLPPSYGSTTVSIVWTGMTNEVISWSGVSS